jgi:hypothetical protein
MAISILFLVVATSIHEKGEGKCRNPQSSAHCCCSRRFRSPMPGSRFRSIFWKVAGTSSTLRGERLGASEIEVQASDAMLVEARTIGSRSPQRLWLANTEADGGWIQPFVAVNSTPREFRTRSAPGEWPLVLGAHVDTADGAEVDYRMTISAPSRDESRRLLEVSRDGGATWMSVFDYRYVRAAGDSAP